MNKTELVKTNNEMKVMLKEMRAERDLFIENRNSEKRAISEKFREERRKLEEMYNQKLKSLNDMMKEEKAVVDEVASEKLESFKIDIKELREEVKRNNEILKGQKVSKTFEEEVADYQVREARIDEIKKAFLTQIIIRGSKVIILYKNDKIAVDVNKVNLSKGKVSLLHSRPKLYTQVYTELSK